MRRVLALVAAVAVILIVADQLETIPELSVRWPYPLQITFLHVRLWQWLALAAMTCVCALTGLVLGSIVRRLIHLRDRFSADPMSTTTRHPIIVSAGVFGAALLAKMLLPDLSPLEHPQLSLPVRFAASVDTLISGLMLLAGILQIYGWWDAICDNIAARANGIDRVERLLVPIMRKLVRAIIVIAGFLIALELFLGSKTVTGMIAGIGVGGIVLALAAKDSVENVFGSLTILFDMPFALGDRVKIDKVEGVVEEINLRSTRIRTTEDTIITLPNANLIRAAVENFGARRLRRQELSLRLSYDCAPEAIEDYCKALRQYLTEDPIVEQKRILVELNDPQETSVGILVQWFIEAEEYAVELCNKRKFIEEALRLRKDHKVVFAAAPRAPG